MLITKSWGYPKSVRVLTRRHFQRFNQQSQRSIGKFIVLEVRQNQQKQTRLGITASRYYGKAVQRNRFKRIVREAFRLCRMQLAPGFDLNVKPRPHALKATTKDIMTELLSLFFHDSQ